MLAAGPVLAAAGVVDTSMVPTIIAIAVALLGGGGIAGILVALGQRKNYVQTGYKDLNEASRQEAADERSARERAEYSRDRWRAHAYALRDEMAAQGITPKAVPPVDHPSEATP